MFPRAAAALLCAAVLAGACSDATAPADAGSAPTPGCQDGTLASRGLYRLCFPAQWNGDLVVYAHGYVSPYDPVTIQDNVVGGVPVSATVTGLGYAFATTSYRANGLVVADGVEDLVELTAKVRALVRPDPRRTFV
ncbi:MAG TPA: hypothetical protein VFS40_08825, partial [Gemmatimonadales bacterium]|nr:hypothetical protein [Gemmatimonadales bacterium]